VLYAIAADIVVITHLSFILFVVVGGLLVFKWPWMAWLHIPAALWGISVELLGLICPLTPLELELRAWAGESGYTGDFVAEYILPVIYPIGLTRGIQFFLAFTALTVNILIYALLVRRISFKAARGPQSRDC